MNEPSLNPTPPPLSDVFLTQLRTLVAEMRAHIGAWGEWAGGEQSAPNTRTMPFASLGPIASSAMEWLYGSNRMVQFDWAEWDEGRAIFRDWNEETSISLDHLTVRKLLTAIARNDRLFEGAWMGLFEDGFAVLLFTRLLELEEALAAEPENI